MSALGAAMRPIRVSQTSSPRWGPTSTALWAPLSWCSRCSTPCMGSSRRSSPPTGGGGGAARSASPCSVPFGLAIVKIVLRQMASLTMKQWQTSNFRMSWWQSSVNRLMGGGYIGKGQLHRMTYFGSQYRNMTSFFNFVRSELFFKMEQATSPIPLEGLNGVKSLWKKTIVPLLCN
jgi:hypothetical protein